MRTWGWMRRNHRDRLHDVGFGATTWVPGKGMESLTRVAVWETGWFSSPSVASSMPCAERCWCTVCTPHRTSGILLQHSVIMSHVWSRNQLLFCGTGGRVPVKMWEMMTLPRALPNGRTLVRTLKNDNVSSNH